jgi:hypothetical protein
MATAIVTATMMTVAITGLMPLLLAMLYRVDVVGGVYKFFSLQRAGALLLRGR